jgi:hypothetical protein
MRPSNGRLRSLLALSGLILGGCSAPVVDDISSGTGSTTEGIVLVERTAAEGGVVQTNVSAKFMRLAAGTDAELAERVVGGSWLTLPAAGECVAINSFGGAEETPALSGLSTIELLDVGDLSIQAGAKAMPLAARAFPDVGDLVSGVFYTSRDARSDLPAPARYVLASTGSAQLDRFAIEADAPAAPEEVRVGDAALVEGVSLEEGSAAVLHWRAGQTSAEGRKAEGDLIYVDLTAPSGTGVRCAYADAGEGVVPEAMLRAKTWGALPVTLNLSVHRVRQGSFSAAGIDAGDLRFDLSVLGRVTLTPSVP